MPIEAHVYLPKNEIIYNMETHRINVGDGTWLADLNERNSAELDILKIYPITIADIEEYDSDVKYVGPLLVVFNSQTKTATGSFSILDKTPESIAFELNSYKMACVEQVKNEYESSINNGSYVTCNGESFKMQIADKDISKVDGVLRFAQMTSTPTVYLTDAENINHYGISVENAQSVLVQMFQAALTAHYVKQQKRDAIMSTTDIKELRALMETIFE